MENVMSLDWLTITYKPQNSTDSRIQLMLTNPEGSYKVDEEVMHVYSMLPIDYLWIELPSLHAFCLDHAKEMPKGRFNYNSGLFAGSGNGYTDFMILYCRCTDTAGLDYAFRQGVNISIPGHYIKTFAEVLGFDTDVDDFIPQFFSFLRDHGFHASRIDIAFDDFSKTVRPFQIGQEMFNSNVISKYRNWSFTGSEHQIGCTFYIGDRKQKMLRIYDKDYESKGTVDSVRYEAEFHEKHAKHLFNEIADNTFNFNFKTSILDTFFKLSTLSTLSDIWDQLWSKGQFSEELDIRPFKAKEAYAYNCKFETTVVNFMATLAEHYGDRWILNKLHLARDNPDRRNKKLEAFLSNCDIVGARSDYIDDVGIFCYGDVFEG